MTEQIVERENALLRRLKERFPGTDDQNAAVSVRRVFVTVPADVFWDALQFARDQLDFTRLSTITGLDTGEQFEFLYHLSRPDGTLLTLKRQTARGDGVVIRSVLPLYAGATFYERELEGLFGVKVEGLHEGRQYPLPDNWPEGQYPMRKDWPPAKEGPTPGQTEGEQ